MIIAAEFLTSSTTLEKCPTNDRAELAFIGRSNVGKSSLINALCKRKNLAHASPKPGKTQLINFFDVVFSMKTGDEVSLRFADLPGYGYAKASKEKRLRFEDMIVEYLTKRKSLEHIFVLIDSNIPPQTIDIEFVEWMSDRELPYSIVFTKSDKPTQKALNQNIKQVLQSLEKKGIEPSHCVVHIHQTQELEQLIESLL